MHSTIHRHATDISDGDQPLLGCPRWNPGALANKTSRRCARIQKSQPTIRIFLYKDYKDSIKIYLRITKYPINQSRDNVVLKEIVKPYSVL